MDYRFIECLSNGVVIEKINTFEIVYMNSSAKELLNVPKSKDIVSFKNILNNEEDISNIHKNIITGFDNKDYVEGSIYLKSEKDVFIEITFKCTWFNEEDNLISYVLEKPVEIVGDKNLRFQEIAESLPSGVIVMDIEDNLSVTYANEEHYKMMGIDIGKSKNELNTLLKDNIYEEDKDWVMEEIYNNLHNNKDVDIEFRMKVKNNNLKWVRLYGRAKESSGGSKMFYSSIKDLSNRREINDKLHLERILFHKITEMSNEILFRLDLKTNIIHFLGKKISSVFNSENSMWENFPNCVIAKDVIFEDDIHIFESMVTAFHNGESKNIEIRFKTPENGIEWYQILYSFVKSGSDTPLLVIGKLISIQKQKILEEQARTDLLTGFYNKINTEIEINKILKENNDFEEHSLMIIDIDNFKSINDNLGHHFGDIVLNDIADNIRSCFRKNDILGRIGGDEFIVFMKECDDMAMIEEKANLVCDVLCKTFQGQNDLYSISASIGIAISPKDGMTYESLYKVADIALYKTKERGKNNYTIYTTELTGQKRQTPSNIHRSRKKVDNFVDLTVITTVFNLLYETEDIRLSLNTILEHIGKYYNVERTYIFETLDCGKVYKNDYQWDKGLGFIEEDRVQYVSEDTLMDILENANEDGVLSTNDIYEIKNKKAIEILEKDAVKAIFIVESLKNRERKAFFGIDDCKDKRVWTEQEKRTLFHVGRMIFGSLTGYNVIQRLTNTIKDLESKTREDI